MDTLTLIRQAHEGDKASRDRILVENTGLIWSVVKRFLNRGCDRDDLFQIGCIGMLKAIDRFDYSFNVAFSTYAVPMIAGEIKRFLRDDGMIKVSRQIKENQIKILNAMEEYRNGNLTEPTVEQIAELSDLSIEEVVSAMEASRDVESIDKEITVHEGKSQTIGDKLEDGTLVETLVLNKVLVRDILNRLKDTERSILILHYFQNKTQTQIASILGMTQVQVSRCEKRIIQQLRKDMA